MSEPLRPPPTKSDCRNLMTVGGDVDRCSVGICLYGDDLDPDSVTALLGAKPTSACRKGDITRGKVYDRVEKQGKWLLMIEFQRGVALGNLINRLLDQVSDDLGVWRTLSSQHQADLSCGLQLECWNRGLGLSPRTLGRIAERGLKLEFDIYYIGESDPPEQT
jgi:hypothetical protein